MHMLLLIGVSVGFALSVLTHNNFYSEKTFTSSANQWKNEGRRNLIAQASNNLPWNVGQWCNGGINSRGRGSSGNRPTCWLFQNKPRLPFPPPLFLNNYR